MRIWHLTFDMFGELNIPSKFQLPSSYCLWINELINELINDKAVYRTAPATPGLLKIISCCILGKFTFF